MSLREVLIFLAGAEAFHTVSHMAMAYLAKLPLDLTLVVVTPTMNTWGIIINGFITLFLIWLASRLPR